MLEIELNGNKEIFIFWDICDKKMGFFSKKKENKNENENESILKEELETDDAGKIKSGIQNVTEAAMKLGEAIYKASQEDGENADKEPGSADFDDNIVDADFEDLDDEKRS